MNYDVQTLIEDMVGFFSNVDGRFEIYQKPKTAPETVRVWTENYNSPYYFCLNIGVVNLENTKINNDTSKEVFTGPMIRLNNANDIRALLYILREVEESIRKTLGFITSIQLVEIVARNLSLYGLSNRAQSYLESMKISQKFIGYN